MIVDTSALVAVLKGEQHAEALARTILVEDSRMSAGSYTELMCVMARSREPAASRRVDQFLAALGIEVLPVSVAQARLAGEAYRVYGRGTGHPAALNYGDTFAYALAIDLDEPLLFVGTDFAQTDVRVAQVL
ncbi:MAG: type II toxin-antitoxin system VapC family toxin [Candidatus Nanopelagicales bacterium]|nr:MAG: type II toxin-antitoxin system VapC family toxin [Actinomycetota bacterium]HNL51709.1 type II toxin-antitoxin system VapC family toxin [Actinomycetota bacterium]